MLQGDVPDLFFVPADNLATFAGIGALRSLDNLIVLDRGFDPGAFYSSAYQAGQENGVQYALPYECAPNMMFVNKTILDREGIPLPDPDWTWEDFLQICAKVTHSTEAAALSTNTGLEIFWWMPSAPTGSESDEEEAPVISRPRRSARQSHSWSASRPATAAIMSRDGISPTEMWLFSP